MLLDDWLEQRATTCPDRLAVSDRAGALTYAELEDRARSVARRLAGRGVRAGSVVAIELPAGAGYAVLVHALIKLGAVALPLNPGLTDAERERALSAAGAMLVVTDAGELDGPEADLPILGEHALDDTQCLILTSGTSGEPRPVALTYGNHLWSAVGSGFNLGVDPDDRWLCCLPLFHVGGYSILMRSAIYGTGAIVHDGFDAERVAAAITDEGVSLLSLVPTQLRRLLDAGARLERLRAILVGGGPVPRELLDRAADARAPVVQTYGLTEAGSQVTTLSTADAHRKTGSAGRPLLTTHVRIGEGEILVQGPTVAPEAVGDDGWLHTGDLGWIDDEGFLYVTGRLTEMIITGGENVQPAEVEEVLLTHPAVADAAVIGREDPEWGEAVTAIVVAAPGATPDPDGLREHCAGALAAFKVPKVFEVVSELPRTASGKLLRRELR